MSDKHIHVEQSLRVANDPGFEFSHEEDHGEFGAGQCAEGHPIRYGYVFVNGNEQVELGGTCQWKVYLFRKWKNLQPQEITPTLIKIGEKFWNIDKEALWKEITEILAWGNVKVDFDRLPVPEQQDEYLKFVTGLLGHAKALRKSRQKEEAKNKAKEITDGDYKALVPCKFLSEYNARTKESLLSWFKKKGYWTLPQRDLVQKLVARSARETGVQSPPGLDAVLEVLEKVYDAEANNAKDFVGKVLRYKMVQLKSLSAAQKNWLVILFDKHKERLGAPALKVENFF